MSNQNPFSERPKRFSLGLGPAIVGGIAGAIGTAIVGLVFSSATLSFVSNLFGNNNLPQDVVVFVSGSDCGPIGSGWKKFEQAQGKFIVAAGQNSDFQRTFQAGLTGTGVVSIRLSNQNLPQIRFNIPYVVSNFDAKNGPYPTMRDLASQGGDGVRSYPVTTDGQSAPFDTLPPWISLTACRKM